MEGNGQLPDTDGGIQAAYIFQNFCDNLYAFPSCPSQTSSKEIPLAL